MATLSSPNSQLPTVWLVPPEGLLPSSHNIKVEPIPIAISSVLALLILLIVTLIFNNMKTNGSDFDNLLEKAEVANKELSNMTPGNNDVVENVAADHTQAWLKPTSRGSSMYSNRSVRKGAKKYFGDYWEDPWDFDKNMPVQAPKDIAKLRLPPDAHHRNGNFDDETNSADDSVVGFDDNSALDSEVSYSRYKHAASASKLYLPGYPASYYPSEFKPLAPEDVGMHGNIWK
ncbi:Nn.00g037730.m01.CDS01 [Neocucurbitaria sp. VM-36]